MLAEDRGNRLIHVGRAGAGHGETANLIEGLGHDAPRVTHQADLAGALQLDHCTDLDRGNSRTTGPGPERGANGPEPMPGVQTKAEHGQRLLTSPL